MNNDIDDIILKRLREMTGKGINKDHMVHGLASVVIQILGRLEGMSRLLDQCNHVTALISVPALPS